jgi:hypothetical protein
MTVGENTGDVRPTRMRTRTCMHGGLRRRYVRVTPTQSSSCMVSSSVPKDPHVQKGVVQSKRGRNDAAPLERLRYEAGPYGSRTLGLSNVVARCLTTGLPTRGVTDLWYPRSIGSFGQSAILTYDHIWK